MLLNHQKPPLDFSHQRTARGFGYWCRLLNPFRFLLRITEFLAGPPVHEEITSLQEDSNTWRQRAVALEAERNDLQERARKLEFDQECLRQTTSNLRTERDELRERVILFERTWVEVKENATERCHQSDAVMPSASRSREQPSVTVSTMDSWNRKVRLENVHGSLAMQPGTFALLNEDGDDSGYGWNVLHYVSRNGLEGGTILGSSQKAVYDPIKDQVLFCGGPNASSGHVNKLLRYDIAANKWTVEPAPGTWGAGCAYDTNALNFAAREMYVSSMLRPNTLRRLHLDSGTWSTVAQPDSIGFVASEPSAEYFPERDELLWLQTKRFGAWDRSSNTWRLISPALQGLPWRSAIVRYNPVLQSVLILGGGDTDKAPPMFSHAMYVYDRKGKITRLKDSPPSINIYVNHAIVTVDPVRGDFLVIQAVHAPTGNDFTGEIEFWKYRMDTDAWTRLDTSIIPEPSTWWSEKYPSAVLAAPIAKYGVVMFMSAAPQLKSKVYLYKHG